MKPLTIVLKIVSPIEIPKFPVHLDGLLFWALGGDLEKLDTVLAKKDGIYCASAMTYARDAETFITAGVTAHPTRTLWDEFNYKTTGKRPVRSIIVKGGPYRKKMISRNSISTPYVKFNAVGDADKIKYLLSVLGFIGTSNNLGFGEISEIHIENAEADFSFFDENGELARILPINLVPDSENYIKQKVRFKPSYTNSDLALCSIPNHKQIVI